MFKLHHAACYTKEEEAFMSNNSSHLVLFISGLEFYRAYTTSGKMITDHQCYKPHLSLIPALTPRSFRFGKKRENWVIQFDREQLRWNPDSSSPRLLLRWEDHYFELPHCIPITEVEVPHYRECFRRVQQLLQTPDPVSLYEAELQVQHLLIPFLKVQDHSRVLAPEELLKQKIDQEKNYNKSLSACCQEIGYSVRYLRERFQNRYYMCPEEYRQQVRLNHIKSLLTESGKSMKEIADIVGMKNNTHLNCFIRRHCNMTPRELRISLLGSSHEMEE
ncbi:MAG: helix-turn-helix transcriptional regulator [Lentisphaeria bacterium]|nr:helix-turn-helix transcriptional regulator [Lentisphaeria bacterium]